ncbi:hypothetical protein V6Z12_D05G302700 [Gossypium hirsutum]
MKRNSTMCCQGTTAFKGMQHLTVVQNQCMKLRFFSAVMTSYCAAMLST